MKIAINTISVDRSKGGIRIYLLGIVWALVHARPDWQFILLCSNRNLGMFEDLALESSNVKLKVIAFVGKGAITRILADQLIIPLAVRGADVLLTPSNVATFCTTLPQLVIIQAPLVVRSIRELPYVPHRMVSKWRCLYYDYALAMTMKRSTRVIAVSRFLADRLVELYPLRTKKITVVQEGAGFGHITRVEQRREFYILFVSNLYPYKNADCLIRALARVGSIDKKLRGLRLKICGKDVDGTQVGRLRKIADLAGLADQVEFLGSVPHDELPGLYRNALAFVYPSCVETFGLPILEAMAFGTPVICSDKMSVPEVGGDAALIVDPFDVEALAVSIVQVVTDEDLSARLIAKGYAQVEEFTWKHCADGLAHELEQAVEQSTSVE